MQLKLVNPMIIHRFVQIGLFCFDFQLTIRKRMIDDFWLSLMLLVRLPHRNPFQQSFEPFRVVLAIHVGNKFELSLKAIQYYLLQLPV